MGHSFMPGGVCRHCGDYDFDLTDIPCPGPDHYTDSDF